MNLPARTARQSGGLAIAQLQGVAWVPEDLMGFADDDTIDAYPSRQDPLFGAALRRVRMFPQQPIQQGAALGRIHKESDCELAHSGVTVKLASVVIPYRYTIARSAHCGGRPAH